MSDAANSRAVAADRLPDPADERFPTVICPFCGSDVDTYQHPAGGVLMCEHRKPNKQWSCEGGGRAPANPGPVSAAVSPAPGDLVIVGLEDQGHPFGAAVSPAEPPEEDCDERIARLRAAATDVRLRDAQTVGALLDDAVEALEAAYAELGRAEDHHRWHHEQEGREVEPDEERMRVLMVIAEALDSLGANDA